MPSLSVDEFPYEFNNLLGIYKSNESLTLIIIEYISVYVWALTEVHARHKTNEGRIVIDKHPQISGEIS
jgi:hypothetical protein